MRGGEDLHPQIIEVLSIQLFTFQDKESLNFEKILILNTVEI